MIREDILRTKLIQEWCRDPDVVDAFLEEIPAYHDPEEGRWIEQEEPTGDIVYECSECGVPWVSDYGSPQEMGIKYCPNCGSYNGGRE